MTKVNVAKMFEQIKVAVDNNDTALAIRLEKEILGLTVIDNYLCR